MRKTGIILLMAALLLCLAGAASAEVGEGHALTQKQCDFYTEGDPEEKYDEQVTLYFLDGVEDLPWVDAEEWAELMIDLYRDFRMDDTYALTARREGNTLILERETGYTMTLDFENDTLHYDDFNAFVNPGTRSTLLDLVSIQGVDEEGNPALVKRKPEACFERYGDEFRVDLKRWGIRMLLQDGKCYVPLQTMNDFTVLTMFPTIVYNGESLFRAVGDELYDPDTKTYTPLGELYRSGPKGMRSPELAEYSYNELCLVFDLFYGLKDTHRITSFRELFQQIGYEKLLLDPDPRKADMALSAFIYEFLDDLHSVFKVPSPLCEDGEVPPRSGPDFRMADAYRKYYRGLREKFYPDGFLKYEEVGNTAYITFDRFVRSKVAEENYYGAEDGTMPEDTVGQIIAAHREITREGSPIENVVLDLTCNSGGAVDSAMYVLGWMLGEAGFNIRDTSTGAMSTTVYQVDVNLDHVFDERDTLADKRLYCLISPASFSCGNLVPSVLKASGRATLIGRTTGGGSCIVLPMSTAYGTLFTISSPRQISMTKNGAYYNVDEGVEPDYFVDRLENLYDRKKLTEYINGLF